MTLNQLDKIRNLTSIQWNRFLKSYCRNNYYFNSIKEIISYKDKLCLELLIDCYHFGLYTYTLIIPVQEIIDSETFKNIF